MASIHTPSHADDKMKAQWEETPQEEKDKYGYERSLLDFLADLVADLDRRCCGIFRYTRTISPKSCSFSL